MTILVSLLAVLLFTMTGSFNTTAEAGQSPPLISTVEIASPNESVSEGQNKMKNRVILTLKATYKGFQAPTGIAVDKDGNLYVSNWSGSTVTKVDTEGSHRFADGMGSPAGLAFDEDGNLYISELFKGRYLQSNV